MIPSNIKYQHRRQQKKTTDLIEKETLVYEVDKKRISKYSKKEK
jgi:hypothetical protein